MKQETIERLEHAKRVWQKGYITYEEYQKTALEILDDDLKGGNMTITTKDTWGKERTYEVVEKIPAGFMVWNIGENMGTDEYIPLCEKLRPNDKECYDINPATVKAIKLDAEAVKILRNAASWGINNKRTAESALKRSRKSWKRELAGKALLIFENISE